MALLEEFETQGNKLFRYRSYLPLVFLVISIAVFYYNKSTLQVPQLIPYYWFYCLGVGILGVVVRIYTVGHTPANTSGRNTADGQIADQLNQTGIYSLVRHPLYLGNFLMWLAIVLLAADIWFTVAFTLAYWLYYERIMYAEESFLRKKFGNLYTDWAATIPAFIPSFKKPLSPKYPFSIKKVLKKEKNGVAALFSIFYIFDCINTYCEWGKFIFQANFWFWGFLISTILYLILKCIKKYSSLFDEAGR